MLVFNILNMKEFFSISPQFWETKDKYPFKIFYFQKIDNPSAIYLYSRWQELSLKQTNKQYEELREERSYDLQQKKRWTF